MGGLTVLYTALQWQPHSLSGVIASSPAIRPAMGIPKAAVMIGRVVARYFGHFTLSGQEKGEI